MNNPSPGQTIYTPNRALEYLRFGRRILKIHSNGGPNDLSKHFEKVAKKSGFFDIIWNLSEPSKMDRRFGFSAPNYPQNTFAKRFWTNVRKFARGESFWDTFPPNIRPHVLSATCSDLHGNSVFLLNQVRRFRIHHQNLLKLRSTKKGFANWNFCHLKNQISSRFKKIISKFY